jgi:Novel toxin 21/Pretoxin HINT domain
VLLASGAAIPISQLKPGDKVLATNTKTGRTRAEPVTAVLLHHDTDRYNLKVRVGRKTAVIDTTRSHLFWDSTQDKWVKAGKLKHGDRLRTSTGAVVTVVGGHSPKDGTGWMWDLSVPGGNDHDFYIDVATTAVLVHNWPLTNSQANDMANRVGYRSTNYISRGQRVFTNGKTFITQDVDSHSGGLWKMAQTVADLGSKATRMGTYDYDLNYIGP